MSQQVSPKLRLPMVDSRCGYEHRGADQDCRKKADYRMVGSCANCKSRVVGLFTVGHEANGGWNSPKCPVCQCTQSLYWKGLEDDAKPPAGASFTVWMDYRSEGWHPTECATLAECFDAMHNLGHTGGYRITRDVNVEITEASGV